MKTLIKMLCALVRMWPLFCAVSVGAQLVQESFDGGSYVPGATVAGLNGGVGFTSAWSEGASAAQYDKIQSGSLTYPSVVTSGNSVLSVPPPDYYSAPLRSVNISGADGSTIWIGFLMRKETDNTLGAAVVEDYFGLVAYGSASGAGVFMGDPGESLTYSLGTAGAASVGGEISAVPVGLKSTAFLATKISFRSGPDTIQLFVNPTVQNGEPTVPSASKTDLDLGDIVTLGFLSGYDAVYSYDEIRIARTFNEVAGIAAPAAPQVKIASRPDGSVQLDFEGVLESRATVSSGAWTQASSASPLIILKGQLGRAAFYRARRP